MIAWRVTTLAVPRRSVPHGSLNDVNRVVSLYELP